MKMRIKVVGLLCALLIVVGTMSGCHFNLGLFGSENVSDRAAEAEYKKLGSNVDKLFYFASTRHPVASNVASFVEKSEDGAEPIDIEKLYASANLSLNKLNIEGKDYLEYTGGAVKLDGTALITDDGIYNFDLAAQVMGVSVDMDIAADKDGISIASPFMFEKPFYIDSKAVSAMDDVDSSVPSFDAEQITKALEKWYNEKLTEENRQYIAGLFKGVIPEDAITVSKARPEQLKGDYITFDVKTECVSLVLDADTLEAIIEKLQDKLSKDETVKDLIVSFLNCFGDDLLKEVCGKTATELYDELMKNITEEYKADSKEETLTINRYFAGGHSVMTEIICKDEGMEVFTVTLWDAYANTKARQFGLVITTEDGEGVELVGGANETDISMDASVNFSTDDTKKDVEVNIKASKNAEATVIDADYKAADDSVSGTFDYICNADGVAVAADFDKDGKDSAALNYSNKANQVKFDLLYSADGTDKAVIKYSSDEAKADFEAKLNVEGENISVKGDRNTEGNKSTWNIELSDNSSEEVVNIVLEGSVTTKPTGKDSKVTCDYKCFITDTKNSEIAFELKLTADTATDLEPKAPTKDGAVVIDGEFDEKTLTDNLKPTFMEIVNGIFGGNTEVAENVDPDLVGVWTVEYNNQNVYYVFYPDGTGYYEEDEGYADFVHEVNDDRTQLVLIYSYDINGNPDQYLRFDYVIDGDSVIITFEGDKEVWQWYSALPVEEQDEALLGTWSTAYQGDTLFYTFGDNYEGSTKYKDETRNFQYYTTLYEDGYNLLTIIFSYDADGYPIDYLQCYYYLQGDTLYTYGEDGSEDIFTKLPDGSGGI